MFTGIVEKSVPVLSIVDRPGFRRVVLASDWPDVHHGDSIAVNGCCLTVAEQAAGQLMFDAIPETLSKTNLGLLKPGHKVHVERAMRVGDRFDGHFVQGHVDATGRLIDVIRGDEFRIVIEPPLALMKFMIPRGSVSLDGVSLTIARLHKTTFEMALIPTTLQITQLGAHEIGWPYNVEADTIAKTIVNWLENWKGTAEVKA
jgi:riboflavin synthase alpha subunit